MAERDGERGDGAVVVDQAVEQRALAPGFIERVADDDEDAGQDFQVIAVAAELFHAGLHVGVEALAVSQGALAGEDGLGGFRGDLPAGFRRAGLHDHRPALDRAGDVDRAADGEFRALVVQHV